MSKSPLGEKSMLFILSVLSRNSFATLNDLTTWSTSFIVGKLGGFKVSWGRTWKLARLLLSFLEMDAFNWCKVYVCCDVIGWESCVRLHLLMCLPCSDWSRWARSTAARDVFTALLMVQMGVLRNYKAPFCFSTIDHIKCVKPRLISCLLWYNWPEWLRSTREFFECAARWLGRENAFN